MNTTDCWHRIFAAAFVTFLFVGDVSAADDERPFRLMSPSRDAKYRQHLPKLDDEWAQGILDDPALILYTDREMPPAYQDWSSGLPGIHSPNYNVSANGSEPFGNANIEFPWGAPGGTHRTNNVSKFRFLWLPRDENGKQLPIVWYRKFLPGSSQEGYAWTFPVGTVVGEVLQMRSPKGQYFTFELRMRVREYGEWSVDVFRPFPSSDVLANRIKELRPQWSEDGELTKLVQHLEKPRQLVRRSLTDTSHSRVTFHETMGVDSLPPVGDDQLVAELLVKTQFKSSLGSTWFTGTNNTHTVAPTTDARFHVVPAKYDAGFIEVDRVSCMRCHDTVNDHVNEFDFSRDWYGRVRGSDGIFSIHPFDPSSISYNGISGPARLNDQLVAAGLLARFDRSKHSGKVYQGLFPVE